MLFGQIVARFLLGSVFCFLKVKTINHENYYLINYYKSNPWWLPFGINPKGKEALEKLS